MGRAPRLGRRRSEARAPLAGSDEIARVAAAFNRMAGELETPDAALRTYEALRPQWRIIGCISPAMARGPR